MNQIITQTAEKQTKQQDNYYKGQCFEKYIIELFNKEFFNLHKYRKSEKYTNSPLPDDHRNPDIEMELVFKGKRKYKFAVECKWREEFKEGKIKWANDSQICTYRMFQDRVRIPVFIAIGVGGEPSNPEKLFVTPLNNIERHTHVYEHELIPYIRKTTNRFYYDIIQLKLF